MIVAASYVFADVFVTMIARITESTSETMIRYLPRQTMFAIR
jgi:hypothetical protein